MNWIEKLYVRELRCEVEKIKPIWFDRACEEDIRLWTLNHIAHLRILSKIQAFLNVGLLVLVITLFIFILRHK